VTLKRLVLDYSKPGELVVRCLYGTRSLSNPGTKARGKEVSALVRSGLEDALAALETGGPNECIGTSGFTTREDVLLVTTVSQVKQKVKGA
jgi:hypothetical protein